VFNLTYLAYFLSINVLINYYINKLSLLLAHGCGLFMSIKMCLNDG
jgi:hypothetical protein